MTTTSHQRDTTHFTILVPGSYDQPMEIYEQSAAIHMAVLKREYVNAVGEEWNVAGTYILLGPVSTESTTEGIWKCYVGKAPAGIVNRLKSHNKNKKDNRWWSRALLIRKDTTYGFTSTQTGWLEGRLYDLLKAAEYAQLKNRNRPSDETLPPYEQQALEQVLHPVFSMLRLLGYEPTTADDEGEDGGTSLKTNKKSSYGVSVSHLVTAGLLEVDSRLVSTNGAWPATAIVKSDGKILVNGVEHEKPSAAASAVKGGGAANGWDFWALETENGRVSLATLRARYLDSKEPTPSTNETDDD